MSLKIDREAAAAVLRRAGERAASGPVDARWEARVGELSRICETTSKTHIAFLGTAILAKATDLSADVFSIKSADGTAGAYSARNLGHGVLVPLSDELGIDLGRSGREPLNNQPYFRHSRVTPEMIVRAGARDAVNSLLDILQALDAVTSAEEASLALAAFIRVRRRYHRVARVYEAAELRLTPAGFIAFIQHFVSEDSEGGKRAQAVVAGFLDVSAGSERVVMDRVNDPDRHCPGDVGVRSNEAAGGWDRVLEVRDKPVTASDVRVFARKAAEAKVAKAGIVAVSPGQPVIPAAMLDALASEVGVELRVFCEWGGFVNELLFWAPPAQHFAVLQAHKAIYARLVELEVSERACADWLGIEPGVSV